MYGNPIDSSAPDADGHVEGDCDDGAPLAWTGVNDVCGDSSDNDFNGDADCDDDACLADLACQQDSGFEGATQLNLGRSTTSAKAPSQAGRPTA